MKIRPSPARPNFLIIIADDAGWNDVRYNGSEIKTPNLDFLAKNGLRLDRFYVHPTCSPSRASFLTGRPASRMGIVAPISGRSERVLPDTIETLPGLLRGQDSSRVDFAAAMAHMDDNIGQVLHTLKQLNLEKNTLVIFFSDNGAMENWYPTEQYDGAHGQNPRLGSNFPLRDWKTSNYEGGLRVPALVYWKDSLKPKVIDHYISIIDWMPTLLDLSGKKKVPKTLEGQNIWEAVTGQGTLSAKPIYVRGHLQESILKPWKLIRTRHKRADTELELYNIETDPEEKKDRYSDNSEIARKLLVIMQNQFEKDAPTVNADIR